MNEKSVLYIALRIEPRDDDLLIPLPKGGSKRVICKGAFLLGLGLAVLHEKGDPSSFEAHIQHNYQKRGKGAVLFSGIENWQ
jgi:hypothetical protein